MKECYIWLDFGCMDQNGNPAGELKQLDMIMQICDCVFTPIHDPDWQSWELGTVLDIYEDYKSKLWNEGEYSYVNRGWCRVEMFYAANIPLLTNDNNRLDKFSNGIRFHLEKIPLKIIVEHIFYMVIMNITNLLHLEF